MKVSNVFAFRLLLVTALCLSADAAMCVDPKPPTKSFCQRPPVDDVVLPSYLGTWYQAYANKNALFVSKPQCVAARYTALPNNAVGVLNCYYYRDTGMAKPDCVEGDAKQGTDSTTASRLHVNFGSPSNSGKSNYNIAALLGDAEYGYYAAAVYSCSFRDGTPRESWFILVRNPYLPEEGLRQILWRLQCKGYDVRNVEFLKTYQGQGCKYWNGPDGYGTHPARDFSSARTIN